MLKLDDDPEAVRCILARVDVPALTSLNIFSRSLHRDVARCLNSFFPDDHLLKRLYSGSPARVLSYELYPHSIEFNIGSCQLRFSLVDGADVHSTVAACLLPILPPVETVRYDIGFPILDKGEWRNFFASHPEVRSIECLGDTVSESFWDALSPACEDGQTIPWQKLESIVLRVCSYITGLASLFSCLQDRRSAGFELRRLEVKAEGGNWVGYEMIEDFRPLVRVVEVDFRDDIIRRVSPVPMGELDKRLLAPSGVPISPTKYISKTESSVWV